MAHNVGGFAVLAGGWGAILLYTFRKHVAVYGAIKMPGLARLTHPRGGGGGASAAPGKLADAGGDGGGDGDRKSTRLNSSHW